MLAGHETSRQWLDCPCGPQQIFTQQINECILLSTHEVCIVFLYLGKYHILTLNKFLLISVIDVSMDFCHINFLQSYTPVLIRCLMDDTVLELDDASVLKFSAVDETWPDSQVWYLKYRNGFSNPSFMIISKKNGQALQGVGSNVVTNKNDLTNEDQHWRRDGLFIVSQRKHVMAKGKGQMLVLHSHGANKSKHFDFQHFAAESYF